MLNLQTCKSLLLIRPSSRHFLRHSLRNSFLLKTVTRDCWGQVMFLETVFSLFFFFPFLIKSSDWSDRLCLSRSVESSLIRSYRRSFNGFAASLTERERQKLDSECCWHLIMSLLKRGLLVDCLRSNRLVWYADRKEVVSVFPCTRYHLHTTRTWDFIGFPETSKRDPVAESDVIVGVIDCGICLNRRVSMIMALVRRPRSGRVLAEVAKISPAISNVYILLYCFCIAEKLVRSA